MVRNGIEFETEELRAFCRRWSVTELAVFGSVLRPDFRSDSGVDLLVTFAEDAPWDLIDMVHMQDEAAAILGRNVDLVSRCGIEQGANRIVRCEVLATTAAVYAER